MPTVPEILSESISHKSELSHLNSLTHQSTTSCYHTALRSENKTSFSTRSTFLPISDYPIPFLTDPFPLQTLQYSILNGIWKAFDSSCHPFAPSLHSALPHK